jgi:hypothetical protein
MKRTAPYLKYPFSLLAPFLCIREISEEAVRFPPFSY